MQGISPRSIARAATVTVFGETLRPTKLTKPNAAPARHTRKDTQQNSLGKIVSTITLTGILGNKPSVITCLSV